MVILHRLRVGKFMCKDLRTKNIKLYHKTIIQKLETPFSTPTRVITKINALFVYYRK